MSDVEAWDADDFEPELPARPGFVDDKWEGEDEDENVKDNWEDEDEEEVSKTQPTAQTETTQAYQRPKKKPLADRIAEKQAQRQKDKEQKDDKDKEEKRELTAEEKLAEKIRIQKIQEHDSLNLARGLFGVQERSLDKMLPNTEEEFDQFRDALKTKITCFEESPHYSPFLSKLISDLCIGLGVEEVKKLGVSMNSLYHEKDRQRKEMEKKTKKKKSKATIRVDRADDFDIINDATGGGNYYDDDDFI